MKPEFVPILADALKTYLSENDIQGLWQAFDIQPVWNNVEDIPDWMGSAADLITQSDVGNRGRLLLTVLRTIESRIQSALGTAKLSKQREPHERMLGLVQELKKAAEEDEIPDELNILDGKPFQAKSKIREFFSAATTQITVVDNYVGSATLDCLREVTQTVRVLTGAHAQTGGVEFKRTLKDAKAEGLKIQVKQHPKLHDRYVVFNDRCWLLGSSIKDAGKKAFNLNEIIDSKDLVIEQIENKWQEAADLPDE